MIEVSNHHQEHRVQLDSRTQSARIMDSEIYALPAVKSLGPLFKLSEVYLSDYGSSSGYGSSRSCQEYVQCFSSHQNHDNSDKWGHLGYIEYQKKKHARTNSLSSSPGEVKLAKKTSGWGFSAAYNTNKEKRIEMDSWRKKGTRTYNQQSLVESTNHTSCITSVSNTSDHSSDSSSDEVDSARCRKEMMSNRLYLIASTTEQKCSISPQPRLYVAKNSRNNDMSSTTSSKKVLQEDTPCISKYWSQRYQLFSRFDYGIKMDEEGWFSVTPEAIAKHQAIRCGNGVIADLFTGVGGNSIQFAKRSKRVIAIDIDQNKIEYARHNASIYEVDDKINFINADCFSIAPKLKADAVFMSPPWGGPDYARVKRFGIDTMLEPQGGQALFDIGKGIAPHIVMFLPRNVDINQLAELALSATPSWSLEVEKNYLNGRLKAITAYFVKTSKT